jgi:hypothetical protein
MMTSKIRENVLAIWAREESGKIKSPAAPPRASNDLWTVLWLIWVAIIVGGFFLRSFK